MDELLPCPWHEGSSRIVAEDALGLYRVVCKPDDGNRHLGPFSETKEGAVDVWNKQRHLRELAAYRLSTQNLPPAKVAYIVAKYLQEHPDEQEDD